MPSSKNKLNDRQKAFVREYALCYNASEAARKAGYSSPGVMGAKLLSNSLVQKALARIEKNTQKQWEVKKTDVLEQLKNAVYRDPIQMFDTNTGVMLHIKDMPVEIRQVIDGFELTEKVTDEFVSRKFKIKFIPKLGSLELAMKHLGMLSESQSGEKVQLDWSQLYNPPEDREDVIEAKINAVNELPILPKPEDN